MPKSGESKGSTTYSDRFTKRTGHFVNLPVYLRRTLLQDVGNSNEPTFDYTYPSTTGVAQIDYILCDQWVCPNGYEDQYTERVLRLSPGYFAYTPPDCADDVRRKRPAESGTVTLGLFQRATKYTAAMWDAIARILGERSNALLLIHYGSVELDDPQSPI